MGIMINCTHRGCPWLFWPDVNPDPPRSRMPRTSRSSARTPSRETPRLKPTQATQQKNNSRLKSLPRPPNLPRRTLP